MRPGGNMAAFTFRENNATCRVNVWLTADQTPGRTRGYFFVGRGAGGGRAMSRKPSKSYYRAGWEPCERCGAAKRYCKCREEGGTDDQSSDS